MIDMSINSRIHKFNKDRNLLTGFNVVLEADMLREELEELEDANCVNEQIDALCDLIVIATGGLYKLGVNPDMAMDETLKEIESRTGEIDGSGKWRKELTGREYVADYTEAKVYG